MSIIELKNINKTFGERIIFDDFSLKIEKGEFLSVMGNSGSGKTTLLNIIGMLETANQGEIELLGYKNPKFESPTGVKLLRNSISYLFQNYGLVESENVIYNLKISTRFLKLTKKQEEEKINEALEKVGLSGFAYKKVYHLSGGEQQRVALAKIILKPSEIILADEPTGSLDAENRDSILELLCEFNEQGKTILVVTHDPEVAQCATRHINIA